MGRLDLRSGTQGAPYATGARTALSALRGSLDIFLECSGTCRPVGERSLSRRDIMRIARRFNAGKVGNAISPEGTAECRPSASESNTPPRVRRGPKNAFGHRSIPQISLIVFNSVFLEQSHELLLKTNLPMMFLLVPNVSNDSFQLRHAPCGKRAHVKTCQSFSRPFGTYRKVDFPRR